MTNLGQMWPKYLSLAIFAYSTFTTSNLGIYSPYDLVFSRKPRSLLTLESTPNTKASGTFKEYYTLLNKRFKYLHKLLLDFKSKRLAMSNKDRAFFQYNSIDQVYIISPLTSLLYTASREVMIKYVGPVVIYKIIDPHNYLLMRLSCKILRGLSEHETLSQQI